MTGKEFHLTSKPYHKLINSVPNFCTETNRQSTFMRVRGNKRPDSCEGTVDTGLVKPRHPIVSISGVSEDGRPSTNPYSLGKRENTERIMRNLK